MTAKFELPIFKPNGAGENISAPQSRFGDLLEASKLSRLPSLRKKSCENCHSVLDVSDEYQIDVGICRACLKTYAIVGSCVDKYTERKIRRNYLGGEKR